MRSGGRADGGSAAGRGEPPAPSAPDESSATSRLTPTVAAPSAREAATSAKEEAEEATAAGGETMAVACPSCGMTGTSPYCGRCGRRRETRVPPVPRLLGELFREVAGLERRLLRTLEPLLFRPGLLTLEYREGRGTRYVSPIRVYLIASALYFLSDPVAEDRLSLGWMHVFSDEGFAAPAVFVLLTVPVLASVLDLVFRRARRPWSEHLVAAFHVQSFLFLLWIVTGAFNSGLMQIVAAVVASAYVGETARRLWMARRVTAYPAAVLVLVLYSVVTGLVLMLAYGLLRGVSRVLGVA